MLNRKKCELNLHSFFTNGSNKAIVVNFINVNFRYTNT